MWRNWSEITEFAQLMSSPLVKLTQTGNFSAIVEMAQPIKTGIAQLWNLPEATIVSLRNFMPNLSYEIISLIYRKTEVNFWSVLRGELHALLLLPLVAEPDAYHVLFEVQFFGDGGNFFARRSRLNGEIRFEAALFRRRY